ncbi:MAG: PASTA domain-containing protein [Actinobacteria bacterium]|nr:MAG: PASTA domain-containing protein [Actinomycetota bacterium]
MKSERRRLWLAAGLVGAGLVIVAASVAMALVTAESEPVPAALVPDSLTSTQSAPIAAAVPVEVPDVVGEPLAQAEAVLATYFTVERREAATAPADAARTVLSQSPGGGALAERGSVVVLTHAPGSEPAQVSTAPAVVAAASSAGKVVVIDAGHQRTSDQRPEPLGPGSSETKMRVTGGTTGVSTGKPEYVFTLELSERVRKRLEAAGVKVVMVRTAHDVSISNAERAQKANAAGADLFLRVHADGNTDRSMRGLSTLYPAKNSWTGPIHDESLAAAKVVHAAVIKSSGAKDRGLSARGDLTGFNWSKVPSCLVEAGFMSNAEEDALLVSDAYQEKLAAGIAAGVLTYLGKD